MTDRYIPTYLPADAGQDTQQERGSLNPGIPPLPPFRPLGLSTIPIPRKCFLSRLRQTVFSARVGSVENGVRPPPGIGAGFVMWAVPRKQI